MRNSVELNLNNGDNRSCLDLSPAGQRQVVVQLHDESGFPPIPVAATSEEFIDGLSRDRDDR